MRLLQVWAERENRLQGLFSKHVDPDAVHQHTRHPASLEGIGKLCTHQLDCIADETKFTQHVEAGRAVCKGLSNARQGQACVVHYFGVLHNPPRDKSA